MTADTTIELHHLLKGPEDAPVLVLANSLGTSLNVWDEQVEALPSASPRSWSPALTTPLHHPSTGGSSATHSRMRNSRSPPRHDIWPTSSSPRRSRGRCSHTLAR